MLITKHNDDIGGARAFTRGDVQESCMISLSEKIVVQTLRFDARTQVTRLYPRDEIWRRARTAAKVPKGQGGMATGSGLGTGYAPMSSGYFCAD